MLTQSSLDSTVSCLPAGEDPKAWMEVLRRRTDGKSPRTEIDSVLAGLAAAVDRLQSDHGGLSAELITVYEQLGIVFEVTHRIVGVRSEWEVVELIRDSLSRSFGSAEVRLARPSGGGWNFGADEAPPPTWCGLFDQVRADRKVFVAPVSGMPCGRSAQEAMLVPVMAGEQFICAIVLIHTGEGRAFRASDMLLVGSLATFCGDILLNHWLVRELHEMSFAMVRALVNAVDQKDEYTSGHSIRVGFYATQLGMAMKLSASDLQMLQWSALLHDVGKIGIRDDVLKKPGKLTDEEFAHIKEHPVRSHKVVQQVPQLARALDGVLHHHEHYDGSGYPEGLRGETIPLQARIIQIADVFDALTSTRSYRKAHDWRSALEILRKESGTIVDPQLQQLFDTLMRSELGTGDDAWERLLARANAFTHLTDLPVSSSKGSAS